MEDQQNAGPSLDEMRDTLEEINVTLRVGFIALLAQNIQNLDRKKEVDACLSLALEMFEKGHTDMQPRSYSPARAFSSSFLSIRFVADSTSGSSAHSSSMLQT
jgi:hypothetical protein